MRKHLLAIAAAFVVFGCAGSNTAPMESVALVLSGSAHDGGWNESGANGLDELRGEGYATSMMQNVLEADQTAALENYAKAGFSYVIAHGGEFSDDVELVSARYPNVRFIQTSGRNFGPNWRSLNFNEKEIGYIAGYMAALASPSGKVGMILQKDEPVGLRTAAQKGVLAANPEATFTIATTEDWDTPSFAIDATQELLAAGVDSIAALVEGGYTGVHEALMTRPEVKTVRLRSVSGLPAGQAEVQGGVVLHSGGLFKTGIVEYKNGVPTGVLTLGFRDDALTLSNFADSFPESARAQVRAAVQGIIDGTIVP